MTTLINESYRRSSDGSLVGRFVVKWRNSDGCASEKVFGDRGAAERFKASLQTSRKTSPPRSLGPGLDDRTRRLREHMGFCKRDGGSA